jgi:hypothetical protein
LGLQVLIHGVSMSILTESTIHVMLLIEHHSSMQSKRHS